MRAKESPYTHGPLYNTVYYKKVLDITLIFVGPQLDCFCYVYTFHSHYNTVWIANMEIGLDPSNCVINRLRCTCISVLSSAPARSFFKASSCLCRSRTCFFLASSWSFLNFSSSWISTNYKSLHMRKPTIWVPTRSHTNYAVQSQKMVRGWKFWIYKVEELYYSCSENKGADQLRSYCEADLNLCFRLCRLSDFPCNGSY